MALEVSLFQVSRMSWDVTATSPSGLRDRKSNTQPTRPRVGPSCGQVRSPISVGPACRAGLRGHAATSHGRKDGHAPTWSGCATHGSSPHGESPFRQKGPTSNNRPQPRTKKTTALVFDAANLVSVPLFPRTARECSDSQWVMDRPCRPENQRRLRFHRNPRLHPDCKCLALTLNILRGGYYKSFRRTVTMTLQANSWGQIWLVLHCDGLWSLS